VERSGGHDPLTFARRTSNLTFSPHDPHLSFEPWIQAVPAASTRPRGRRSLPHCRWTSRRGSGAGRVAPARSGDATSGRRVDLCIAGGRGVGNGTGRGGEGRPPCLGGDGVGRSVSSASRGGGERGAGPPRSEQGPPEDGHSAAAARRATPGSFAHFSGRAVRDGRCDRVRRSLRPFGRLASPRAGGRGDSRNRSVGASAHFVDQGRSLSFFAAGNGAVVRPHAGRERGL